HLLRALHEFEQFYNSHRPHQGIANARPLRALPSPIPSRPPSPGSTSTDATASPASSTSISMPLNLHGRDFRQAQTSTPTGASTSAASTNASTTRNTTRPASSQRNKLTSDEPHPSANHSAER